MEKKSNVDDVVTSYLNSPNIPAIYETIDHNQDLERKKSREKSTSFCNNTLNQTLKLLNSEYKSNLSIKQFTGQKKKLKSNLKKTPSSAQKVNGHKTTRENCKNPNIARINCMIELSQLRSNDDLMYKFESKNQPQDYTPIVIPFQANDTPIKSDHKLSKSLTRNDVLNYLKEKKNRGNSSHKTHRLNSAKRSTMSEDRNYKPNNVPSLKTVSSFNQPQRQNISENLNSKAFTPYIEYWTLSSCKKRESCKFENQSSSEAINTPIKSNKYESRMNPSNEEKQTGSFTSTKSTLAKNLKQSKTIEKKIIQKERSRSSIKNPKPK